MRQYQDLLLKVLREGDVSLKPRTGTYVLGVSSAESTYDMRDGFPLLTTKNVPPRLPFEELSWKLRGEHTAKGLFDRDIHIWDGNAFDYYLRTNNLTGRFPKNTPEWNAEFERFQARLRDGSEVGELGPVYGFQWRHWRKPVFVPGHMDGDKVIPDSWRVIEVDQLREMLENIIKNPGDAYHNLDSYNVGERRDMALAPCPFWHQFSVWNGFIDLSVAQRSCDVLLGIPFNIAQDSRFLHMVAKETKLKPRFFHHKLFNTHFYLGVAPRAQFWTNEDNVKEFRRRLSSITDRAEYMAIREWYLATAPPESEGNERKDHIPFVLEQLSKEPRPLPNIEIADVSFLEAIEKPAMEVTKIQGYNPHKWDSKAAMAA